MVLVKLYYGPYESHGAICHKEGRLWGLIESLTRVGYEIELIPAPFLNRLEIVMGEHQIFRCDLRYLVFNVSYYDEHCEKIVNVVKDAANKIYDKNNVPKFSPKSKGKRALFEKKAADTYKIQGAEVQLLYDIPNKQPPSKSILVSKSVDLNVAQD